VVETIEAKLTAALAKAQAGTVSRNRTIAIGCHAMVPNLTDPLRASAAGMNPKQGQAAKRC